MFALPGLLKHRRVGRLPPRNGAARFGGARTIRLSLEGLEDRTLLSLSLAGTPLWFGDVSAPDRLASHWPTATVELTRQGEKVIAGRLTLPGVLVDEVLVEDQEFTRLEVPGWGSTGQVGQASLPYYGTTLVIPQGTAVVPHYHVDAAAGFHVSDPILPSQPLQPLGDGSDAAPLSFAFDAEYYSGKTTAQRPLLAVSEPAVAREITLVSLEIAPFQYDPVTGNVTVVTGLTFSLQLSASEAEEDGSGEDGGRDSGNPLLPLDPAAAEADYLIIAAHDLYDPSQPTNPVRQLAEWKRQKGFKTHVLRLPAWSQATYTAEDIREYIAEAYRADNPTSYVLLVGDDKGSPTVQERDCLVPSNLVQEEATVEREWYATDHLYACIEGDDLYPELTIARLPVDERKPFNALTRITVTTPTGYAQRPMVRRSARSQAARGLTRRRTWLRGDPRLAQCG